LRHNLIGGSEKDETGGVPGHEQKEGRVESSGKTRPLGKKRSEPHSRVEKRKRGGTEGQKGR